jgi:CubicO group peptidase (beta-lactamase class C family)
VMQVPGYPEPSPALKNAVKGSVLRAPMHRRLWLNDPDCLMLRPTRTRLRSSERAIGAAVVGGNGGFVVLSDDLALYGEEQWRLLERLRSAKESTDAPLDLVDPFGRELKVRSAAGSRLEVRLGGRSTAPPGEEGETRAVLAEGGSRTSGPWARLSIER